MTQETNKVEHTPPKPFDVIEIISSHYVPTYPIGNIYVVIGCEDGYDAEIIDENGKYNMVCWEDYKIIGNAKELKAKFIEEIRQQQNEMKKRSD